MASFFKAHRLLAFVVLAGATAWVATGEFSQVGGDAHAEGATPEAKAEATEAAAEAGGVAKPIVRTVATIVPVVTPHEREIRLSGATEADKTVQLAARSSGIIKALNVSAGSMIAAGDLVVELEGPESTAAVATAKASLAQATEQLEVGEKLFAGGSLPELELTTRRAAKAAAEAQLTQAEAALDRLLLRAPFGGIVDTVDVETGEWVQPGAPITTILSLDPIVVKAEISERDIGLIREGSKAKVELVTGQVMEGTIRHLSSQASRDTRTFIAEIALPNADRAISAGMTAQVTLFAASVDAVVVPRSIITLSDAGEIGLRVVGPDNLAQFVKVDLVDDTDKGMVVTGVPAGVKIIVAGQDLVRDGDTVITSDVDPAGLLK